LLRHPPTGGGAWGGPGEVLLRPLVAEETEGGRALVSWKDLTQAIGRHSLGQEGQLALRSKPILGLSSSALFVIELRGKVAEKLLAPRCHALKTKPDQEIH
jgi:hypothetical protein